MTMVEMPDPSSTIVRRPANEISLRTATRAAGRIAPSVHGR